MALNTIEEIIDDIRQGKMVILMDDEDRENEGDLIMAASWVRPEDINFMVTHARGLVCMPMSKERCEQLKLPLMVNDNNAAHSTAFTLSIEAAEGVTTGISAADRATTIRTAVAKDAKPGDIVQPGHIFPLMAVPGGVLNRAGHTEAGVDLARLAGLEPAAVIVEILNEDGSMARRPELEAMAKKYDLKIGTVADLIEYRLKNEHNLERVGECEMPTDHGDFHLIAYKDHIDNGLHFALVKGDFQDGDEVMVRVHMQSSLCDVFGNLRPECGWPLSDVMRRIDEEGQGAIVILRQNESDNALIQQIQRYQETDKGVDLPKGGEQAEDLRTYGIGAQILKDLGVHKMRVMSSPKRMHALSGFGLEVVEYVTGE
ncbi:MAG: 3,4-dihydroxy-2-butanone-4-phosphate synthase [Gammaproteobacteria bacterium]|nr:3,4-dihydroxy-2-butanone-4-phosphate synthase [Gammaproteobacteria bacterium]